MEWKVCLWNPTEFLSLVNEFRNLFQALKTFIASGDNLTLSLQSFSQNGATSTNNLMFKTYNLVVMVAIV